MNTTDIKAIKWQSFDPREGNYEDCTASVTLQYAADLTDHDIHPAEVEAWASIDFERTAFKLNPGYDGLVVVWIVTMDWDGAPDGHSAATRVEVIRV